MRKIVTLPLSFPPLHYRRTKFVEKISQETNPSKLTQKTPHTVQGGKISALTRTLKENDQFIVTFGNPKDSKFCSYPPTCDNSDGLEWQNGGPAPAPKNPPSRKRHYYPTARGTEVLSAVELGLGKRVTSFEVDGAKAEENMRRLGKRDPRNEYRTVEDEIAEHLFLFDFCLLILCWVNERNCWVKLSEAFVSYIWGDKCCLPVVNKFLNSTIHRQE